MAQSAPDWTLAEAIKLFGGLAGLVSAAFLIWDRWARGRPLAWVTAKEYWASRYQYIRIQNPGPADLFIRKVRAYPPIYSFAKDHKAESIAAATIGVDVHVLLAAGETHDLVLIPRDIETPDIPVFVPRDPDSRRVSFYIHWRKTSSSWLWQIPVTVRSSARDIEQIAAATTKPFDEVP